MKSPKVEILALCNYATFSKSGGLSIIDIFDELYAEGVPTTFARCAIAMVIGFQSPNSPLFLSITIEDPKRVVTLRKDVQVVTGDNGKGNFIFDIVGLELKSIGKYSVVVRFGKTELARTNFMVIKAGSKRLSRPLRRLVN